MAVININANILEPFFKLIDDLFTSDEERAAAKFKFVELASKAAESQVAVNAVEAASKNMFVAGWRPFIGWTCGAALAWTYLLAPVIQSVATYTFMYSGVEIDTTALPQPDLNAMLPILMGLLGLGGLRTFEKLKGTA